MTDSVFETLTSFLFLSACRSTSHISVKQCGWVSSCSKEVLRSDGCHCTRCTSFFFGLNQCSSNFHTENHLRKCIQKIPPLYSSAGQPSPHRRQVYFWWRIYLLLTVVQSWTEQFQVGKGYSIHTSLPKILFYYLAVTFQLLSIHGNHGCMHTLCTWISLHSLILKQNITGNAKLIIKYISAISNLIV